MLDLIVRVTFTLCETLPPTPVTGIVYVPGELKLSVEIVSVDEPEPAIEVGDKVAVALSGKNDGSTLKATVPVKPFVGETVMV